MLGSVAKNLIWEISDKTPYMKDNWHNSFSENCLCTHEKVVLCRQSGACGFLSGNHMYIVSMTRNT